MKQTRIKNKGGKKSEARNKSKKVKKQYRVGGLELVPEAKMIDPPPNTRQIFHHILSHSDGRLISYGSLYGLMFKLVLHETPSTNYIIHKDSDGNDNKEYIIKFGFIDDTRRVRMIKPWDLSRKATTSKSEFIEEADLHRELYNKSLEKFKISIVPDVMENPHLVTSFDDEIINKLANTMTKDNERRILNAYLAQAQINFRNAGQTPKIGLYIMKRVEGTDINYTPILNQAIKAYYRDTRNPRPAHPYVVNSLYDRRMPRPLRHQILGYMKYHILLAILGYIHGDAHFGNILIDYDYRYERLRDIKIIDFGRMTKSEATKLDHPDDVTFESIRNIIKLITNYCDKVARESLINPRTWNCNYFAWIPFYINQDPSGRERILNVLTNDIKQWWKTMLEEAPAPVQPAPAPVQPRLPAPARPRRPGPAPVQPAPSPVQPAPSPVQPRPPARSRRPGPEEQRAEELRLAREREEYIQRQAQLLEAQRKASEQRRAQAQADAERRRIQPQPTISDVVETPEERPQQDDGFLQRGLRMIGIR